MSDPVHAIKQRLQELVRRNSLAEGIVYLQITRGTAPRNHLFPKQGEPVLMAYCNEYARPLAAIERGSAVVTVPDIRWLNCHYKTLNLLPNVLAKQQAPDAGADDAVLHRDGIVTEASASNVMIVSNGTLVTHPANHLILHGITRAVVLRLAAAAEMRVEERTYSLEELRSADEVLLTGTTIEVMPVISVDGVPTGSGKPGPAARRLHAAFEAAIPS